MITDLTFENFRGFQKLELKGLSRVNLLTGANNTGKTGVLEGLCLLFGNSDLLGRLPTALRSNALGPTGSIPASGSITDDFQNFWQWMVKDKSLGAKGKLRADLKSSATHRVKLELQAAGTSTRSPSFLTLRFQSASLDSLRKYNRTAHLLNQTQSIDLLQQDWEVPHNEGGAFGDDVSVQVWSDKQQFPQHHASLLLEVVSTTQSKPVADAAMFSQATTTDANEKRLESLMRLLEPRLTRLRYLQLIGQSHPLVYADVGLSEALPSTMMGQAFTRSLHIFCQMLARRANILVIDEIENGLHWSALPDFWKVIAELAKSENVQIFATTHSRECIQAAHQAFTEASKDGTSAASDLAVIRLERTQNQDIRAVTMDAESLAGAFEFNMEIR